MAEWAEWAEPGEAAPLVGDPPLSPLTIRRLNGAPPNPGGGGGKLEGLELTGTE